VGPIDRVGFFRAWGSLARWVTEATRMMRLRNPIVRPKREFGRFKAQFVSSDAMFGRISYSLTRLKVAEDFVGES